MISSRESTPSPLSSTSRSAFITVAFFISSRSRMSLAAALSWPTVHPYLPIFFAASVFAAETTFLSGTSAASSTMSSHSITAESSA